MEPSASSPLIGVPPLCYTQDLRPRERAGRHAVIVTDLGYGDAGKGSITDWLCRHLSAHTVIRYNGGAQAAHNVVTDDGRAHTFAQFGSGSFISGVRTVLSRHMLIEPFALFNEAAHLDQLGVRDSFARLFIDRHALIITPFHAAANRLRELGRGDARHGSCGMGIGETVADALTFPDLTITAGMLPDTAAIRKRLWQVYEAKREQIAPLLLLSSEHPSAAPSMDVFRHPSDVIDAAAETYAELAQCATLIGTDELGAIFSAPGAVIFEGAQGVLLDQDYGFAPYHTWSKTTPANALDLLTENGFSGDVTRLGVLRTYFTRHGAGPFVTEDHALADCLAEAHNAQSAWQGAFRVGWFDAVAAKYALEVSGGVDGIALTHLDRLASVQSWQIGIGYQADRPSSDLDRFFAHRDGLISAIRVPTPADLAHQTALAQQLFQCTPIYAAVAADPAAYADAIESTLKVPVIVTSQGSRPFDKRVRVCV
ncbi:MAG: adenylosuccinate synthetase [Anaerolineae bacterium]